MSIGTAVAAITKKGRHLRNGLTVFILPAIWISLLAIIVTIGGARDLRRLFRSLERQAQEAAEQEGEVASEPKS